VGEWVETVKRWYLEPLGADLRDVSLDLVDGGERSLARVSCGIVHANAERAQAADHNVKQTKTHQRQNICTLWLLGGT
jgi:hypothetical protein